MFNPYHPFTNCTKLRAHIQILEDAGQITTEVLEGHKNYNYALTHKLKCANYYIEELEKLLTTNYQTVDIIELHFKVNRLLDGFFYSAGSSLDILAREILTYFGITLPPLVYFRTAREQIDLNRTGDPLLPRLQDPQWKEKFSDYRNVITHENFILGAVNWNIHPTGNVQRIKVPLPDNPRVAFQNRTYIKNIDALDYCEKSFKQILAHISPIYGDIIRRAANLPL